LIFIKATLGDKSGANMTENTDASSLGVALLDRNDGLQEYRGVSRPVQCALPTTWKSRQAPGAGRQVRQGGVRPQERAPDYQLVAAWSTFLIFIGAGAFVLGMAIHNETLAAQKPPRPAPIASTLGNLKKSFSRAL